MAGYAQEVIALYANTGRLFSWPDDETARAVSSGQLLDTILSAASSLPADAKRVVEAAQGLALAARESIGSGEGGSLQEAYVRVFGHALSPDHPPYETQYGDDPTFRQPQRLANVRGFYRAFGVEVPPEACERADHFGVEMEFLAVLTAREATAALAGDEEAAQVCTHALERFLGEHLGPVLPTFRRLLEKHVGAGFYVALARLAEAICTWDCARRNVAVLAQGRARLVPVESVE